MGGIKRVVIQVLIPLQISSIELVKKIGKMKSVESVDINVEEVERTIEIANITIIGDELDFEQIRKVIEDTGASIQSIDRVSYGKLAEQ